jgi:hypothetical protein
MIFRLLPIPINTSHTILSLNTFPSSLFHFPKNVYAIRYLLMRPRLEGDHRAS